MKRSQAERVRADAYLSRLRATLSGVEIALRHKAGGPPGSDVVQALMYSAMDLATCLTKIEAYERAEESEGS
jgi:hypothetical protein